ncbi:inositol monophosphatase family protein [Catellatospora citrea]|uniref:Inositol-1-monophosphatase n=1 Tax=Catellatospora citrea TaxID=53366 RepID=A0A8J3NZM8_9ACTN|nr:inositol monophosphatase family protein [Catellatospora citrea]RKE10099.1 myo-inositol-1(or 4)-monophosphatase [Catellatospora citrea]GIF97991.1 inositol monophosphatase [Catellatospora citrea]
MNELELLDIAVQVAADAADTARRMRNEAINDVGTKSTATDVVTAADRAVEQQVIAALAARRPGDTVLGEEFGGAGIAGDGGVRWIVDPIDGTVNYLYGLAQYAVSIAAEVDGEVVAGVVRNAATGDTWTAARGHGAWRDGRRLTGSPATELALSLVGTGFGYARERRVHQAAVVAQVLPLVRDIRRMGAAALDLCAAAEGMLDAYYEKGLAEWDMAAGGLIAREAGLLVTGLSGRPAGGDMVLAAPPALHGPLDALLTELVADGGP